MHDIFYFTDIHGQYDLYHAIMDYCHEQDPESMIIFGGDAIDRGESGYIIMKELLNNPQVVYLKGNHEDMFVHAAWMIQQDYRGDINEDNVNTYLLSYQMDDWAGNPIWLSLYNGGYPTLHDWMLDEMPSDIVDRINKLPLTFSYEKLDFCHAGGRYKEFQRVSLCEYNGEFIDKDDLMMLIWDRNYLGQGWMPDRTCIFGHTPVMHLAAKYYGKDKSIAAVHPCAYYATLDNKWTGRKIDMDTGAVFTKRAFVLNVLTMKAYGFEIKNDVVEKIEVIQF